MNEDLLNVNAAISRDLAANGMVLLKNDNNTLPLAGKRVTLLGRGAVECFIGGGGSSCVVAREIVNLPDALQRFADAGELHFDRSLCAQWELDREYLPSCEELAAAAQENDLALVLISRNSSEGDDKNAEPGDFYLADSERELLTRLAQSQFKEIAVVLNVGRVISLEFAREPRIGAVMLEWQPGAEGGVAAAELLLGKRNFSGRLADTFAAKHSDYPARDFCRFWGDESYDEDIFVGYRYFETIPGAAEKVLYPFGFGLSYTTFETGPAVFAADGDTITVRCTVTNTGSVAGREVLQLFRETRDSLLEHPARELVAFAKTPLLHGGESASVVLTAAKREALRSFDEEGVAFAPGCWIIDRGCHIFHLGSSVRATRRCGELNYAAPQLLEKTGNLFSAGPQGRLHADGSREELYGRSMNNPAAVPHNSGVKPVIPAQPILLRDVAEGRAQMEQFIAQLTADERIALCQGRDSAFPQGTAGIGNLPKYGVPNAQTADGPAGLRKSVPTTGFPCETLIACSWDTALVEAMGRAIGVEGIASDVDILLAPGLNIHRSPLCGRNFEYYSEDPLLSGRCAAAMVRGVQSQGLGATLKHFAVNDRERNRVESSSFVSDRALREIYLRGFEIAVKEGHPWCIMSSYNSLNGCKTSSHYHLLTTLLRGEWGFDGLVMTDWGNDGFIWKELAAGNDLAMPVSYNLGIRYHLENGYFPLEKLDASVRRVLELVMKTHRFKTMDFGPVHKLSGTAVQRVRAFEMAAVSCRECRTAPAADDGDNALAVTDLFPGIEVAAKLHYNIELAADGCFALTLRYGAAAAQMETEILVDDRSAGCHTLICNAENAAWRTSEPFMLHLAAGRHTLTVALRNPANHAPENPEAFKARLNYLEFSPVPENR